MDVAGQVQVEVFHRNDLRVPATGSATCKEHGAKFTISELSAWTFDAECRALRWLSNTGKNSLVQMRTKRLTQTDGRGAFAFSKRGGNYPVKSKSQYFMRLMD